VIADASFMSAYELENSATGPIMGQRAMFNEPCFMYGAVMQPADKE